MSKKKRNAAHRNTVEQLVGSLPSPEDSWAMVELWRWQYGTLPQPGDMRPLDPAAGLRGMADAIRKGDRENFPSPGNVVAVLEYAARLIPANVPEHRQEIREALEHRKAKAKASHDKGLVVSNVLKGGLK